MTLAPIPDLIIPPPADPYAALLPPTTAPGAMAPSWRDVAIRLIATVAQEHGVSPAELLGTSRHRHIITAKQAAMLAVRERMGLSYPVIGELFNRDHTTVLHGCLRAERRRAKCAG